MSHKNLKIGIIGGTGWMGKIMGEAILQKKLISADQLWISNRSGRHSYSAPVHFTTNSQELIDAVDVVLIAVRPFQILQFKADIKDKLLISIMARLPIAEVETILHAKKVIRAMPNAAVVEQLSYTPWCANNNITQHDKEIACAIFNCFGIQDEVENDDQIDFLTALTGSSHGYLAYIAQCLIQCGVKYGLKPSLAERAIRQVMRGIGQLIATERASPQETLNLLTSYGDVTVTEAILTSLQQDATDEIIARGINKSYQRASEKVK